MVDPKLEAIRREFADLTGLFENAALIASSGQGVQSRDGGRRQLRRILKTMDRIRRCLFILERRLK